MANKTIKLECTLDRYTGMSLEEVSEKHDVSKSSVHKWAKEYEPQKSAMLRLYYKLDENRQEFLEQYKEPEVEVVAEPAITVSYCNCSDTIKTLNDRVESLEEQIKKLYEIARSNPEPAKEPLPELTLGSNVESNLPRVVEVQADTALRPLNDIRSQGMRVHVVGQAVDQWRKCFGNGSHGVSDVSDHDIIRRIIGIFYSGTVEGHGKLYKVSGVNRYSLDGVVLTCTIQQDTIYISKVEQVELTAM